MAGRLHGLFRARGFGTSYPTSGFVFPAGISPLPIPVTSGPDPALANLGRDADLYVVEATSRNQQPRPSIPADHGVPLTASCRRAGDSGPVGGANPIIVVSRIRYVGVDLVGCTEAIALLGLFAGCPLTELLRL